MTFKEYLDFFQRIVRQEIKINPYNDLKYVEFTKLNFSRFNRWLKIGEIHDECIDTILLIDEPQEWVIISEHWCGDAAHSLPFIIKLASYNSLIDLKFQLRDSKDSEIDLYLTNGTKSIPILIGRKNGEDIFKWGPRPKSCIKYIDELKRKNKTNDQLKEDIQKWYNTNKGHEIQAEICYLLKRN